MTMINYSLMQVTALAFVLVPITLAGTLLALQLSRQSRPPRGIPWVGLQNKQWFPKVRAALRGTKAGRGPLDDGYCAYSKKGLPFVLPTLQRAEIVLPPSDIAWIVEQPEHVLSGAAVREDDMGLEYLAHGQTLDSVHDFSVIRSLQAQRYLHNNIPAQMAEISYAFATALDPLLLDRQSWTEVSIVEVLQQAIAQVITRTFLGVPLCRNKQYGQDYRRWAVAFEQCGYIFRTYLPDWLKPIIGPLLGAYVHYYQKRAARHIIPIIQQHVHDVRNGVEPKDKPGDVLRWLVSRALKSSNPAELDATHIAGKLLLLTYFAEPATSTSTSTALLDLLSYPDYPSLIHELRSDSQILFSRTLTHSAMLKTLVMTSLVRESLRFHPLSPLGLTRKVVAPEGVVTPTSGLHIPQNCYISVNISALHRDSEATGLVDAEHFRPRRYFDGSIVVLPGWQGIVRRARVEEVDEKRFLSFGGGGEEGGGCPGRHFGGQVVKLALGFVVMRYEFEGLEGRGMGKGGEREVDEKVKVRVKRRRRADGRVWEGERLLVS